MSVEKGDKVKVNYTGKLDNGKVFDTTEGKEPLEFEAGASKVIKGFDDAVVGMEKGEEKQVKIPKEQAYGDRNPALIRKIPKAQLSTDKEPKPGMVLILQTKDGQKIPVKITEVSDTDITIDLNHPLAGQNLNFKIKVEEIVKPQK